MLSVIRKLKGENRLETIENYSISGVVFGALMFSVGIGSTVITPKGIPTIISMLGALVSFISTVLFIFTLLIKDSLGKE